MILTREAVDEVLQTEDLEGLLALGAPQDEYSQEASEIHSALLSLAENRCNQRDLSAMVLEVWDHSFGPFGPDEIARRQPILDRVAQRLLARAAVAGKTSASRQSEVEGRL